MVPSVFHLHYQTPDIEHATATLADHGITPNAKFGSADGESVSLSPDETPPDEFKLRLQTNRGGSADVTLAPGPRVKFDHFGVVVEDVAAVVERAEAHEWPVVQNERRTFLTTPWRFRIELQAADSDVVAELGDRSDCELSEVLLAVPVEARDTVDREIRAVVGDVSNLRVVPARGPEAGVRQAFLSGTNVEDPHLQMSALALSTADDGRKERD
ncbi:VOC family protein [Haloferax sp. DFSO60]|uniref:VOC family protein n=1 Tax=Haloferax sp. DFSO60 TaxID=3388652 RepID=UPI00397AFC98